MKKIITFTDTGALEGYYRSLIKEGAKPLPGNIFAVCSHELRRAEVITAEGDEVELIYINVHVGDLLLWNREADEVDIDSVLKALSDYRKKILDRVRTMHIESMSKKQDMA